MSNMRVVCAVFRQNTLSFIGSGLCHTARDRCNITYTQQSEIRKNIVRVIQDATATSPLSSCCGHILQNMIHAHREICCPVAQIIVGPSNVGPRTTAPVDIRPWSRQLEPLIGINSKATSGQQKLRQDIRA
ncbi:hypothetical protein TcCL_Unassigned01289 [Trypanosoma cruzi]|nr:hypothetical protein TcCL_Unassigned01289 [Trypanosoma cruzi]